MSYEPKELSEEDVLFVDNHNERILLDHPTYKVGQMITKIKSAIRSKEKERAELWLEENEDWFEDGVTCEALKISSRGWLKGRVRIKLTLEFCPEEGSSTEIFENKNSTDFEAISLDEIRQTLAESNS